MKIFYTAFVFSLLLVSCKDKPQIDRAKTDWAFYKLSGDVETLLETTEPAAGQDATTARESEYDTEYTFNNQGMLISEKKYLPGRKLFQEITYNGKDKIVKQVQYVNDKPSVITEYAWDKGLTNNTAITKRNADNSQLERIGMKYNANGKITEKVTYNRQDLPIEKITYEYDNNGNLRAENFYLDKDIVQVTNIYEYNGGNKISEVRVKPDGSVISKTFFEYNASNKVVRSGTNDSSGKLQYIKETTYDSKGNILTDTANEVAENNKSTDKYTYDANGNKTQWVSYTADAPLFEAAYKYDSHNNMTSIKMKDYQGNPQPLVKSYTYDYDKQGNWIKKTVLVNGKPAYITTRIISYF